MTQTGSAVADLAGLSGAKKRIFDRWVVQRLRREIMYGYDIDDVSGEEGVNKENLQAALELGRLVADETGLCCEALGDFIWGLYKILEGEEE